jgi:hypothetical protein
MRRGDGPVRGASSRREEEALVWSVREERGAGGDGGLMAASVSTWDLMLEIWPVEERPEQMKKREFVNALSFDQMVTYKKLFDARMKKEGKGEGEFGHDNPVPVTMYEGGPDDCASQLHAAR